MMPTFPNTISPRQEMLSYETLWAGRGQTLKSIADMFRQHPVLPSELLRIQKQANFLLEEIEQQVLRFLSALRTTFSVSVYRDHQYPNCLRTQHHPAELFYYRGDIGLIESRCISVVGARKCTDDGKKRAARIAKELVHAGYTVVSGLAAGIDTAAMTAAITAQGRTIGVIGTPLSKSYPRENVELQEKVAREHLLISQVPFYRYAHEPFSSKSRYFPERNETMAALSSATIIVEASDTSGSLVQARSCLQQGRKLFILKSCFDRSDITWPATFEKRGAIRVQKLDDVISALDRDSNGKALEEN